ncbi:MAG: LysR family transcriptional regulator [Prosthecobacter sp.]|nr:LysR family transcriptional regulator [Prosthecobacter sp.]
MSASTFVESPTARVALHVRVLLGAVTVLGPGKVELLTHIRETGSISEAARKMEMSYQRAWRHVKLMNELFPESLVISTRGGAVRGGASLTELGGKVLTAYAELRGELDSTIKKHQKKLLKLLEA